jgi:ELWxxDGT repeat protein
MKKYAFFLLAALLLVMSPLYAQYQLVKEVSPTKLTAVNGNLYFVASDQEHENELWKSDGTTAGTMLVKDILPNDSNIYTAPSWLVNKNGTLYFVATDPTNDQEIWKSDGTEAGTVKVTNLQSPGSTKLTDCQLTNVNGTLYFLFDDGIHGNELWKSDGTATGTKLVNDLTPGSTGTGIFPLCNNNGTLYFVAYLQTTQLWKSDGTAAGTVKVTDLSKENVRSMVALKGEVYFTSYAENSYFTSTIWASDGTAAGTRIVKQLGLLEGFTPGGVTNDAIYFAYNDQIWKTDGTSEGTGLFKAIKATDRYSGLVNFAYLNGYLYFLAEDKTHGRELWRSDETPEGTVLTEDGLPGTASRNIYGLVPFKGQLLFSATNGEVLGAPGLWKFIPYPLAPPAITTVTPGSGPVGTIVTFTGTGFSGITAVQFNGTDALAVDVNGDTYITATVPPGATSGMISFSKDRKLVTTSHPFTVISHVSAVSFNPDRNLVNASPQTNVSSTFSEPISPASASAASIKVFGSQTGLRKGIITGGGTLTLTFNPATDFRPGEEVRVSLSDQIRSADAKPLVPPMVYSFRAATASSEGQLTLASTIAINRTKGAGPIATADLDGDGDLDLVVGGPERGFNLFLPRVYLLTNDGSGHFIKTDSVSTAGIPSSIQLADLDADGDVDILTANLRQNFQTSYSVRFNDGTGHFAGYDLDNDVNKEEYIREIITVDIDGDGDLDVVGKHSRAFFTRKNDGTGYFGSPQVVGVQSELYDFNASDLDGDGDQDLAFMAEDRIIIYWNDHTGGYFFGKDVQMARPYHRQSESFLTADLDRDGDLDMVVNKEVFFNDGTGDFYMGEPLNLPGEVPVTYYSLQAADIDGDGDLDLGAMGFDNNYTQGEWTTLLNNGQGKFTSHQKLGLGEVHASLIDGDFNGDGKIDFVAEDVNAIKLTLLINQVPTFCTASGSILREVWTQVPGGSVSAVPTHLLPDSTSQLTLFEGPTNVGDNYASRIRGYVCVPRTGKYTFRIASDNEGQLFLSSDDNPANKVSIAFSPGFPNPRQWNIYPSQTSAPIELIAGRRYYIEALHKEAYGSDHLSVSWETSYGNKLTPIPGSYLSPYVPVVCSASGSVSQEVWTQVPGNTIAEIPLLSPPSRSSQLTSLQTAMNSGDKYGQRLRGYICAPQTGDYTFWIVSDNEGELYLSTDDNPAHKQLRAFIRGGSAYRGEWEKYSSQKSATIHLVAGQRYYLEVLHKEGYGSDHLIVGWRLPRSVSTTKPVVVPGSVLSPYLPESANRESFESALFAQTEENSLTAAPNPFSDQLNVSFVARQTGRAELELFDLQGKKVQSVFVGDVKANEVRQAEVKGSHLKNGLYLLRLVNGTKVTHLKLVLAK